MFKSVTASAVHTLTNVTCILQTPTACPTSLKYYLTSSCLSNPLRLPFRIHYFKTQPPLNQPIELRLITPIHSPTVAPPPQSSAYEVSPNVKRFNLFPTVSVEHRTIVLLPRHASLERFLHLGYTPTPSLQHRGSAPRPPKQPHDPRDKGGKARRVGTRGARACKTGLNTRLSERLAGATAGTWAGLGKLAIQTAAKAKDGSNRLQSS